MALSKELEELVAALPEEDRKGTKELLEKHQSLRDGYLRQNDYDRKMNEAKDERKREQETLNNLREKAERWQKWADDNVPRHDNLMKEFEKVSKRNKELEEQVRTAAAAHSGSGGGEMDEQEVLKRVQAEIDKRGYVSKEDVPALVAKIAAEETAKQAQKEREDFFKTTLPDIMEYGQKLTEFQFDHRKEFNEPFDRKAFSKFVSEKGIKDMDEGYKLFVSDKRTEKVIKEEVEKRTRDAMSKLNLPGSGAAPAPELGHIQARRSGQVSLPDNATISEAATAAAAELRAEGKA